MRPIVVLLSLTAAFAVAEEDRLAEQAKLLGKGKPEARLAAAQRVAAIAAVRTTIEPHTRMIARALRSKDPALRQLVGKALLKAGPEGIPWLIRALKYSSADARTYAARALARIGKPALPALAEALGKVTRSRAGAAEALGYMGADAAPLAPMLIEQMSVKSRAVRRAAVRALGPVGALPERVAPLLVQGFDDTDFEFAENCLQSVAMLGPAAVPPVLAALEKHPERTMLALGGLLTSAAPALENVLRSGPAVHRLAVAHALARRGLKDAPPSTIRVLVGIAGDGSPAVRAAAAAALGVAPASREVTQALLERARDSSPDVRAWAALGMAGRIGLPAFAKLLEDPSADVRAAALYGAAAATNWVRPLAESLRKLLAEEGSQFAARALGRMGRRAAPAVRALIAAAEAGSRPATEALASLLADRVPGGFVGRRARFARAPKAIRTSVRRALDWLARTQEADGGWIAHRHGGHQGVDVGVTALALLAFLGAGEGPHDGPAASTVRRGLEFLLNLKAKPSNFEILQHAMAIQAIAEAWGMSGLERYRAPTVRGVAYLEFARNPGLAWRYSPRAKQNDTHNTTWAANALLAADLAGHAPPEEAYAGARDWLDKMTDLDFGAVGYNMEGGGSSNLIVDNRPQVDRGIPGATAMGHWTAFVLGVRNDRIEKGAAILLERPPQWKARDQIDFIYWRFGAMLLSRKELELDARPWFDTLHNILLRHQAADGQWPPAGHWGPAGGAVYSTAMGALALLPRYTYPAGFPDRERLDEPFAQALQALERIRDSKQEPTWRVADRALRRYGSGR